MGWLARRGHRTPCVGHGEEVGYLVSTSNGHMVWVGLRCQLHTPCPEWTALPPAHHALAA